MPNIQMEVIPEPKKDTAPVLVLTTPNYAFAAPFAVMKGGGDTDYLCGGCRAILASQVNRGQFVGLVFKCLNCNSHNVVRGT